MPSSAPDAVAEVDVGERLRDIRRLRRATLRTIAERAGVSESFLSQVERGRASASIASLRRIAGELGGDVHELESGDSIDYRSSTPHRVANVGEERAEVMWIISPPSY